MRASVHPAAHHGPRPYKAPQPSPSPTSIAPTARPDRSNQSYALDTKTLAIIEAVVFAFVEAKRYESFKKTGEGGALGIAPFDPMGMRTEETRVKEVKNARLGEGGGLGGFCGGSSCCRVQRMGPVLCGREWVPRGALWSAAKKPAARTPLPPCLPTPAMLAFVGFCSQAAVRGLGPIDCLKLHLEDPWRNNSERTSPPGLPCCSRLQF